jgi:hypothetical protein
MFMTNCIIRYFCFLSIFFVGFSSPSIAQYDRDINYFYVQTAIASTAYFGDLNSVNSDKPLFGLGYKGGGGYSLTEEVTLGIDYRVGNHPRTDRPNAQNYTKNHTVNLYASYRFPVDDIVTPYVRGGLGMTFFGTYDKGQHESDGSTYFAPVFGPTIGGGVSIRLTDQISLFFEGLMDIIFDDEALDETKGNTGLDVLGFIGGGVRIALRPTFRPVGTVSISGPSIVTGMESVVYEVVVGGNPSEPVRYQWDLGDGTKAVGSSVSHVYLTPDTYEVRVRVSNGRSVQTSQTTVIVRPPE